MFLSYIVYGIVLIVILISIRQINEYQRGVVFTLGRYTKTNEPGWRLILPVIQSMRIVDIRVKAVDVPDQKAITKDNIPVIVNAVIYYKIRDAAKAVIEVENFMWAISQFAQTTMRNVVGMVELDELLSQRESISTKIREIVDKETDPWGISVNNVELKDIGLHDDMERTIAKQAEAEREKRAVIIKAEGEKIAAGNMSKAAEVLHATPGAMHLRTLQSLNDISSDQSNTIVFTLPLEVFEAFMQGNKGGSCGHKNKEK